MIVAESPIQHPGRTATYDGEIRHILNNQCACCNDSSVTDSQSAKNRRPKANPYVISDVDSIAPNARAIPNPCGVAHRHPALVEGMIVSAHDSNISSDETEVPYSTTHFNCGSPSHRNMISNL